MKERTLGCRNSAQMLCQLTELSHSTTVEVSVVFGSVDGAGAEGGYRMDFYDVLDRVVDLLRSRGRVSYRALKRQFGLDDAYLEDLKVELSKASGLPWTKIARYWSGLAA